MNEIERYTDEIASKVFLRMLLSTIRIWFENRNAFKIQCGIEEEDHLIPVSYRISSGVAQVTEKIGEDKEAEKVVQVTLISETLKKSGVALNERGVVEAVASSFSTSREKAKRIIKGSEEGKTIRRIQSPNC